LYHSNTLKHKIKLALELFLFHGYITHIGIISWLYHTSQKGLCKMYE